MKNIIKDQKNLDTNSRPITFLMSVAFFAVLFVPHSSLMLMFLQIIILLFIGVDFRYYRLEGFSFKAPLFPFLLIFILSFTLNLLAVEVLTYKDVFSKVYTFLLLLLFPFSKKIRFISPSFFVISIIYILLSQVAYAFNVAPLVSYFDLVYPYQGDRIIYQTEFLLSGAGDTEFISNRRYGGLFHNPNQAMKYMTLCYLGALLFWVRDDVGKFLVISVAVLVSVVLSGSRTAFVIYSISLLVFLVFNMNLSVKNVVLSVVAGGVFLSSVLLGGSSVFQSERAFLVIEGLSTSIGSKWVWLMEVLTQMNFVELLFGNFWRSHLSNYGLDLLDSEWGYLVFDFGLLGISAWLIAIAWLFIKLPRSYRVIFVFLLWSVSSTILMSYRTSFAFFIVLAMCIHLARFNGSRGSC